MEVRQVWSYGGPGNEQFYASFLSDVDWLSETGNVLITAGAIITDFPGAPTESEDGRRSARIMEVTREAPVQKVFELREKADQPGGGWHVYRAQRVPSLYGSASWVRD